MLESLSPENLLIIDIETVPVVSHVNQLSDSQRSLWRDKANRLIERSEHIEENQLFFDSAGILAEFGKVICIGIGILRKQKAEEHYSMRIKSISGDDEKLILTSFNELLTKSFSSNDDMQLCGHNIKEFDVPYLCRRMLINGIKLPALLDISGMKPWQVAHVDTLHLWKFGDYKHYTSLKLLCSVLNVPSSKEDIEGKDVGRVYWMENGLARISSYCQRDVLAVAQLMMRFKGLPLLEENNITIVD